MNKQSERRHHGRVKPAQPFPGFIRPRQPVTIVDLSCSGALLETTTRLSPGQRCRLVMDLENRQLDLAVEVVRSHVHRIQSLREGESQLEYRVGVRFEKLAPEDSSAINHYLARQAEASGSSAPKASSAGSTPSALPEGDPRFKRRGFPRVRTQGLHGEVHLTAEGRVTSVGEGGIAIAVSSPLAEHQALALVIDLPSGPLKATGTVRYCRPLAIPDSPGQQFEVGIAFDQLKREQLEVLQKIMAGGGI